MTAATWRVERTAQRRFPFRVTIERNGALVLAVRAQSAWPGPGQQIFCLRETVDDPAEHREEVERAVVAGLTRVGRKLAVTLDRPTRKRCEFLVIRRTAKDGHEHEQIFFRTQSGIKAHRSRARAEIQPADVELTIAVDSAEKYPWRFPGATVLRRQLARGDYALLKDGRSAAVVERKTFDGMLADLGGIQALHHQLADLARQPLAALVIEAQYGDFLDPDKLAGRWPAPHLARLLAELAVMHPTLQVVYAGNRKLANAWCARFFAACQLHQESPQLELVSETMARYEAGAPAEGVDERIRSAALAMNGSAFSARELASRLADVTLPRVNRVLRQLMEERLLQREGIGRGTRWQVLRTE